MLFSERNGYIESLKNLEYDEISDALRNSLWNEIFEWVQDKPKKDFFVNLWKDYYKKPIDKIPYSYHDSMEGYESAWRVVRENFFKSDWHKVYDLLEFLFLMDRFTDLEKRVGRTLVKELTAYRIINKQFIQITDSIEVDAISESIKQTGQFSTVKNHIESALKLLSNRENPDYRNSIKESISAVEAMAKIITNQPNATLGDALKVLESKHSLHRALKNGYASLYGYANDSSGIRHALMEEPNLTQADAKYFLISCSSFVNYLKTAM